MYILFYIDVTKNAHTHYGVVAWMNANSQHHVYVTTLMNERTKARRRPMTICQVQSHRRQYLQSFQTKIHQRLFFYDRYNRQKCE